MALLKIIINGKESSNHITAETLDEILLETPHYLEALTTTHWSITVDGKDWRTLVCGEFTKLFEKSEVVLRKL